MFKALYRQASTSESQIQPTRNQFVTLVKRSFIQSAGIGVPTGGVRAKETDLVQDLFEFLVSVNIV